MLIFMAHLTLDELFFESFTWYRNIQIAWGKILPGSLCQAIHLQGLFLQGKDKHIFIFNDGAKWYAHPICQEAEVLTFTEATVVAPLILITFLYLPTILYVTRISIRFYGWKNWMTSVLNDPVYFIFPILTSMSFYGKPIASENEEKERSGVINDETPEDVEKTENICEPLRQMNFSVRQSNILYMLFIMGFLLCIGADVLHQFTRIDTKFSYFAPQPQT